MKLLGRSHVRLDDGTVWARPGGDEGWRARYATPDPLTLASFVDCYLALVMAPVRRRNEIIRQLRLSIPERDENGDVIHQAAASPEGSPPVTEEK